MKNKEAAISGINSILQNTKETPPPTPKKKRAEKVPSVRKGLNGNDTRVTYIINADVAERVSALCYWLRVNRKDVVQSALIEYFEKYEKVYNKELVDEKRRPFAVSIEELKNDARNEIAEEEKVRIYRTPSNE